MGWKTLKERFRIEHIVQVTDAGVCIGSAYIRDIIVVGADGLLKKRYNDDGWGVNEDLLRYQREMTADPEAVRTALAAEDKFSQSLVVWSYEGGNIIEHRCEEYGWPNLTHTGEIMYDNRHSANRAEVLEWAKRNAEAGREWALEHLAETEAQLVKAREMVAEFDVDIAKLATVRA